MESRKRRSLPKTAPTPPGASSATAPASETSIRRGRGRPPKARSEPEIKVELTPDSPTPKRGRSRKQASAPREATVEMSSPKSRKPKNTEGISSPRYVDAAAVQGSSIVGTPRTRSESTCCELGHTSTQSQSSKRMIPHDDEISSSLVETPPPKRARKSTRTRSETRKSKSMDKATPTGTPKAGEKDTLSQSKGTPRKQTKASKSSSSKTIGTTISTTPQKRRKTSTGDDATCASTPKSERQVATPVKTNPHTPSNKARTLHFAPLTITPLSSRMLKAPAASSPLTPHVSARSRLHAAAAPEALPCREREFEEIQTALESAIIEETGSCIYVSGTPGTGKTATVRSVVRSLKRIFAFRFVEINGMKITQPTQAYALLWEAISEQRVAAAHALRFLDDEFQNNKFITQPVVVLMDELDQLVTKSQDVMYNFFNWPSLPNSKLIVVAVANIMDLPERTLSNKISSRLGLTRIQFAGYTHTQLQIIIEARLKDIPGNIVLPEAIEFASRKVASVTGDARRALDICRRAVEIAEQSGAPPTPTAKSTRGEKASGMFTQKVTIQHIRKAINESTSSPVFQFLPSLPLICKLIITALIQRSRTSGVAENTLDSVLEIMNVKLRKFGGLAASEQILFGPKFAVDSTDALSKFRYLNPDESILGTSFRVSDGSVTRARGFLRGVAELVESGILFQQNGRGERNRKIRLNVSEVDVKAALKDDPEVGTMLGH
ncbi:P-loop containing nucleoside triphosphate hydrolase protein [Lipomyces chichibuensis]|uniref:P-loop containing nucleoside triphosphate hydrolase protein n=1 Tax=Lipomyces chichibuensis TaxID=1546026 RepID=UPI003343A9A3